MSSAHNTTSTRYGTQVAGAERGERRVAMPPAELAHPGPAHRPLADEIVTGRELILSAALVGDVDDFGVWKRRCAAWHDGLGATLTERYGSSAAAAVERATPRRASTPGWADEMRFELERLEQVIELLDALSREGRAAGR